MQTKSPSEGQKSSASPNLAKRDSGDRVNYGSGNSSKSGRGKLAFLCSRQDNASLAIITVLLSINNSYKATNCLLDSVDFASESIADWLEQNGSKK
jgi:hypothetical protein